MCATFTDVLAAHGRRIDLQGVACDETWLEAAYQKPFVLTCVSQEGELIVSE